VTSPHGDKLLFESEWVSGMNSKLPDMVSMYWLTAMRSDTIKNYRAYRSNLAMIKYSHLQYYGLAVIAC
jgi:hypothetical protein